MKLLKSLERTSVRDIELLYTESQLEEEMEKLSKVDGMSIEEEQRARFFIVGPDKWRAKGMVGSMGFN